MTCSLLHQTFHTCMYGIWSITTPNEKQLIIFVCHIESKWCSLSEYISVNNMISLSIFYSRTEQMLSSLIDVSMKPTFLG